MIDLVKETNLLCTTRHTELNSAEVKRIVRHVGSHPVLRNDSKLELLESINRLYGPIPSLGEKLASFTDVAMRNLVHFLRTRDIQSSSLFLHADVVARRESKCEVTLLIDLDSLAVPKLDVFFLCPVDVNLTISPRTSGKRMWQNSLVFKDLAHSVLLDQPIKATCSVCDTSSEFSTQEEDYRCLNPTCAVSSRICPEIHPGGNRRYFGPIVPDFGRVWVGITEKLERRSDRIGLIKATVYSLFHDPADVNRRGRVVLKFPTASPRVQWAIFPYK